MPVFTGSIANDNLRGGSENDFLYGFSGNDNIQTGDGIDHVEGGDGDDTINKYLKNGSSILLGGTGNDTIWGGNDGDVIEGGDGDDSWLEGYKGNDTISGNSGNDKLFGDEGDDQLDGGAGNDELYAGNGIDTLIGGDGNDTISKYLSNGPSTLLGGSGNDIIWGGNDNDVIEGGDGDDSWLEGYKGNDTISGNSGNDKLFGDEGDDQLDGGAGNDELYGGDGNDILDGGTGQDGLYGGGGNDTYQIRSLTQYIYDISGTDTAYIYENFVKLPSGIENIYYRDGALALPYWIDALLPDSSSGLNFSALLGSKKTFFYNFPTVIPTHYSDDPEDKLNWTAFTAAQKSRAETALNYISTLIGVNFIQSTDASGLNTITFANNNQTSSSGYARYPYGTAAGSDLFLDNTESPYNTIISDGTYGSLTLIHELGHTLGLKHPFEHADAIGDSGEPPYLTDTEDRTSLTVMSYDDSSSEYHLRFSPLDIAALQFLYGPSTISRTGNDTYSVDPFGSNFLWDGGGSDTLNAATANAGSTIYLTPGYWGYIGSTKGTLISSAGQITVNFGSSIENLIGSQYSDNLYGNQEKNTINGGTGNDLLEGWDGDDYLIGGSGNDRIDGGLGTDIAFFNGIRSSYDVSWSAATQSFTVESISEGTDILIGIEKLNFSDAQISSSTFQLTSSTNSLSLIVDKNILGNDAILIKDLKEVIVTLNGVTQSHTVEYGVFTYDFDTIDSLITTVTRNNEFTSEFRKEIAQAYPGFEEILYTDAIKAVGVLNIDLILLMVAGYDGDFVN